MDFRRRNGPSVKLLARQLSVKGQPVPLTIEDRICQKLRRGLHSPSRMDKVSRFSDGRYSVCDVTCRPWTHYPDREREWQRTNCSLKDNLPM